MAKKRRRLAQPSSEDGQQALSNVEQIAHAGQATSAARSQEKPAHSSPPNKRASASIDVLFGKAKEKKPAKKSQKQLEEQRVEEQQPKRRKGSKADLFGNGPSPNRRYDEEGLPIYTPEELGIGKGGDTAACPFDCECCT